MLKLVLISIYKWHLLQLDLKIQRMDDYLINATERASEKRMKNTKGKMQQNCQKGKTSKIELRLLRNCGTKHMDKNIQFKG